MADWELSWGVGDEVTWIEQKLGLVRGRYRATGTGDHIERRDPLYDASHRLGVYRYMDDITGAAWQVAMTELSNGIWVVGYRKDAA